MMARPGAFGAAAPVAALRRSLTIRAALEWAFGAEHARLEFEDGAAGHARPGIGIEAVLLARGQLGCTVDTFPGRSSPADDAEIIAAMVAALPEAQGGRSMAILVADHARTGTTPAREACRVPQLKPADWSAGRGGWKGKTAETPEWDSFRPRTRAGRPIGPAVRYTPCLMEPTPHALALARRRYLGWYGALLHLAGQLSAEGVLFRTEIRSGMPPLTPWKTR